VGRVRRVGRPRGTVRCALPEELSPAEQTFVGLVARALWDWTEAGAGTAALVAGS
jgi:hypothetical protein